MKGGGIDIISITENILLFLFYSAIVYYFIRMIYRIFYSLDTLNFSNLGSQFSKVIDHSGYVGFDINIRTDDAMDDCKIKGKYSRGKLVAIKIKGEGENCENLRNNNNI